MPKLTVSTRETIEEFPTAKSYVIDESGRLHITGQAGNLASFNSGEWQFVVNGQEAPHS